MQASQVAGAARAGHLTRWSGIGNGAAGGCYRVAAVLKDEAIVIAHALERVVSQEAQRGSSTLLGWPSTRRRSGRRRGTGTSRSPGEVPCR